MCEPVRSKRVITALRWSSDSVRCVRYQQDGRVCVLPMPELHSIDALRMARWTLGYVTSLYGELELLTGFRCGPVLRVRAVERQHGLHD